MAVGAASVIRGIMVIPIADYACGKGQQRDERQRDAEDADQFTHGLIHAVYQ